MTTRTPKQYDLGDRVTVLGIWKTPPSFLGPGDYTDPAAVLFKFKNPAGVETAYTFGTNPEIVKEATGHYHVSIDADMPGWWYYKFYATGLKKSAFEGSFRVRSSNFS